MKNLLIVGAFLLLKTACFSQTKFQIVTQNDDYETYYVADGKGEIIKQLDTIYHLAFQSETMGYFHVFAIEGQKGWCAIDFNEKILFHVYNTENGTPSPDEIVNDRIRIVENDLVGFANEKGEIVIKPQFEIASGFNNGHAIIAKKCSLVPWDLEEHLAGTCEHYSTVCEQHGYIDLTGKIIKFGDFTFEEMAKKAGWKNE